MKYRIEMQALYTSIIGGVGAIDGADQGMRSAVSALADDLGWARQECLAEETGSAISGSARFKVSFDVTSDAGVALFFLIRKGTRTPWEVAVDSSAPEWFAIGIDSSGLVAKTREALRAAVIASALKFADARLHGGHPIS